MGQARERKYIVDCVLEDFPKARVVFNCPLGPVPERLIATWGRAKALKVGRGLRPEVDALVFLDHTLVFCEAKIKNWLDGIAKLPVYASKVKDTPELQEYSDWEKRMILYTPHSDETIESFARDMGVEVRVKTTPEVEQYLIQLERYWTPEYKKERAELVRVRRLLGLE